MNYILAATILILWFSLTMYMSWDKTVSKAHNIFYGTLAYLALVIIHWIPFYLIFIY